MDLVTSVETALGLLLVFLLPGYALTKAVFPEWRIRGAVAALRAVEILTLSLVLSIALTILVGFALLNLPGPGFAASWSDPLLELILSVITLVGLALGGVRGAYRKEPPPAPPLEPSPGADDGWALVTRLETIDRERRRAQHALRRAGGPDAERWKAAIAQLDEEAATLRVRREAEYRG
ncbi:MAG: DUF1616 domain-containing protein [Thermoplasmata archaeon]|nr:DUF1616 domain-containing protein [Thermoplasmata archaeon]